MDVDPREAARDRRARRFAGAAAMVNTITALTGLVLGTCVLLLIWPYVLSGAGLLVSFVLLITVGAVGQLVSAEAIWRHLQNDRGELGPPVLAAAIASGVIGIPALCWTPFLARFIADGKPFWGYESVAVQATLVLCIPVGSGLAGLIAWWRYRRVYAAMAPVKAPVTGRFRRGATWFFGGGSALMVVLSWLWPGGAPVPPEGEIRGQTLAYWLAEVQLRSDEAQAALAEGGRPAVTAMLEQLQADPGFRWVVADWMGTLMDLGDNVAPVLEGVRIGRLQPQQLRQVMHALPETERYWLPELMAAYLPSVRDLEAREAMVFGMSHGRAEGVPFLLNVIDTEPGLRAAAAEALLWALPRADEPEPHASADVVAELERRVLEADLDDASQCNLAGTLVRLAPPGEVRVRWVGWLGEELEARVRDGDSVRIGRVLGGIGRAGTAAARLADQIAAMPGLTQVYTVPLRMTSGPMTSATQRRTALWTLRVIAPSHPAVAPGYQAALTSTDHSLHSTSLYQLALPKSRPLAMALRAQIIAVANDGGPNCFRLAADVIVSLDGDMTAVLPAFQAQWKAGGPNAYSLLFALRGLGAKAAPALPFLRTQRGISPVMDDQLKQTIEAIELAVKVVRVTGGPKGK